MWKKVAYASIQDLRQMVFDMDAEVKVSIDKPSSQEQDFKKLGFQVLDTWSYFSNQSATVETTESLSILPRIYGSEFQIYVSYSIC